MAKHKFWLEGCIVILYNFESDRYSVHKLILIKSVVKPSGTSDHFAKSYVFIGYINYRSS